MKCVICRTGDVRTAQVWAELKIGADRLLIPVEGELCQECGEAYYSADVLRHLERVREDFIRKAISPPSVGMVYQVS
jgi:YgiT-type zinc finger domain-containing protein